ncbi:MAG: DNRLRE domain-containing protein [Bacteroidota bacterium]
MAFPKRITMLACVSLLVLILGLCTVGHAATYSLSPTADAYVRGGASAALNFGTATNLEVKNGSGDENDRWTYVKFSLSGVTGAISSATLKLYVNNLGNGMPAPADIHSVTTDSWTETGLTWNNRPAPVTLLGSKSITALGWITQNVTSFVTAEYSGDKTVTFAIRDDDPSAAKIVRFDAKEAANAPVLEVITSGDVTPPPIPTPTPTPTPTIIPTPTITPPPIVTPTPSASPGINLALNKAVTCSKEQVGNEASHAVDGDLVTRWSADIYPQWMQVDLGATYSVSKTEIAPLSERAYRYKVEVSTNGTGYTQVVDRTNNTQGGAVITDTFAATNARYVKLTVTGAYGYTGNWISINEFRVFSAGGSPPPVSTPTPTPTPTPTVTPTIPPVSPAPTPTYTPVPVKGLWTSAAELAKVPMSGAGWTAVLNAANAANGSAATVANQDSNNNVEILAAAIVYARTGTQSYKDKVVTACQRLVSIGNPGDRSLAWGRETGAYALAADLVGYRTAAFEAWLRNMAETYICSQMNMCLLDMFKDRPNNWGSHAFGSLVAIYGYLGDTAKLNEVRNYFLQSLSGPKPPEATYGSDLSWHVDQNNLRWINPQGAIKSGLNIDGIIPDDQRRNGSFSNPPNCSTDYHWEGQQGWVMGARILHRLGMSIYSASNQALYRAMYALQTRWGEQFGSQWRAGGDDLWMLKFMDSAYGSNFSGSQDVWGHGKNAGWAYVTLAD